MRALMVLMLLAGCRDERKEIAQAKDLTVAPASPPAVDAAVTVLTPLPKKRDWCLHPDSEGVCWAHSKLGLAPKDKRWKATCTKYVGTPTCLIAGRWIRSPGPGGVGSMNVFELEQVEPPDVTVVDP